MTSETTLSIVAPMHNEEACALEFLERVDTNCKTITPDYEIIIINDASSDNTETIVSNYSKENPRCKLYSLARNSGQWAAIYAGIQQSTGKHVVIMDSDLQHLPEEIHLFVDELKKGVDCVSGVRQKRQESLFIRRIPSLIANYLLRSITGCPSKDMGGFKGLQGDLARSLQLRAGQHRFLPALAWIRGGTVSDIPISAPKRTTGASHYGLSRAFDVLFDIILLWFQYSFKQRPIYLFGHMSLWVFALNSCVMAWLFYEKFVLGIDMGTRPPFFFSLAAYFASFLLISVGFVLEFISNILNHVTNTKPYRFKVIKND